MSSRSPFGGSSSIHAATSTISPHTLRSRLADIDAETARLHARLASLAAERKPIVEALQSVVYPAVLDIPVEITSEIFLQCVTSAQIGGDPDQQLPPDWVTPCSPLLLASICRRWREIALSLPAIWSDFYFEPQTAFRSTEKLLACWLPRTGTHPLTVALRDFNDIVFASLSPYMHKIQKFTLAFRPRASFPNEQIKLPFLRSLHVYTDSDWEAANAVADPTNSMTAFVDLPHLREVFLAGCPLHWISLPWAQLTTLDIVHVWEDELVSVLRQTSALEVLVLSKISEADPSDDTPVRLAHLRTLKLNRYQPEAYILQRLTLPSLNHIEFALPGRPRLIWPNITSDEALCFVGLVQRSDCSLRSITIADPMMLDAIECLRSAGPTLEVVTIQDTDWPTWQMESFLDRLADSSRSPILIPNLKSLSLNPCRVAVEIQYIDLAAMLAYRREDRGEGTSKLESFELVIAGVDGLSYPKPNVSELNEGVAKLQALRADGLEINIRCPQKWIPEVDSTLLRHLPRPRED